MSQCNFIYYSLLTVYNSRNVKLDYDDIKLWSSDNFDNGAKSPKH